LFNSKLNGRKLGLNAPSTQEDAKPALLGKQRKSISPGTMGSERCLQVKSFKTLTNKV